MGFIKGQQRIDVLQYICAFLYHQFIDIIVTEINFYFF